MGFAGLLTPLFGPGKVDSNLSAMNIKMESGRVIGLESLAQDKTYAGVLMGPPRTHFNNGIIGHFREKAEKKYSSGRVIVLEPVRIPRTETGRIR